MEAAEELLFCDQVEFVKGFCYLVDSLNASGRSEAGATRTRSECIKLGECGKLLHGRECLSKIKGFITVKGGRRCCTGARHDV